MGRMVGREGIEPPQSKTADLQSAELTTCSTCPRARRRRVVSRRRWPIVSDRCGRLNRSRDEWSRGWESNPQPPVYKTDALPLSYLGTPIDDSRPDVQAPGARYCTACAW